MAQVLYNIIGAPVQYSCHLSFPQLQDMQNPSFIVVERKIEKEKNYRIVCLHTFLAQCGSRSSLQHAGTKDSPYLSWEEMMRHRCGSMHRYAPSYNLEQGFQRSRAATCALVKPAVGRRATSDFSCDLINKQAEGPLGMQVDC
jgi:hypothetical protein